MTRRPRKPLSELFADLLAPDCSDGRRCAECQQPFNDLRPPTEPVELRTLEAGRTVPRLRVVAWGSLCAACARARISTTTHAQRRARS